LDGTLGNYWFFSIQLSRWQARFAQHHRALLLADFSSSVHNTRAGVLALLAGFAKYNCDLGLSMISGSGTVLLLRCSGCMALGSLLLFNLRDGSDLPPGLDFVRN